MRTTKAIIATRKGTKTCANPEGFARGGPTLQLLFIYL